MFWVPGFRLAWPDAASADQALASRLLIQASEPLVMSDASAAQGRASAGIVQGHPAKVGQGWQIRHASADRDRRAELGRAGKSAGQALVLRDVPAARAAAHQERADAAAASG